MKWIWPKQTIQMRLSKTSAPWSTRYGQAAVVFNGHMWVLGGGTDTVTNNGIIMARHKAFIRFVGLVVNNGVIDAASGEAVPRISPRESPRELRSRSHLINAVWS